MNVGTYGMIDTLRRAECWPTAGMMSYPVAAGDPKIAVSEGGCIVGQSGDHIVEAGVVRKVQDAYWPSGDGPGYSKEERAALPPMVRVAVDVVPLDEPVRIPSHICNSLPANLQPGGVATKDNAYLNSVSPLVGQALWNLVPESIKLDFRSLADNQLVRDFMNQRALFELLARSDLSAEQKAKLVDSYHGRGPLRAAAEARGYACPFCYGWDETDDVAKLALCFIKPWRDATDEEKLDPDNVLLVDPMLVSAFNLGALTMEPSGYRQVSSETGFAYFDGTAMRACDEFPGVRFTPGQQRYLAYHNKHIFLNQGRGPR